MTSIRFLTRTGCHLCEDALAVLRPIATKAGVGIEIIDIDLDLDLLTIYNDRVPVVERSNGTVIAEGVIDPGVLASAITALR